MYSYYFPNDQNMWGGGHRHDWEVVIVWVSLDWSRVLGTSVSGHGDYVTKMALGTSSLCNRSHPLVKYRPGKAVFQGDANHQFMHNTGSRCPGSHSQQIAFWWFMSEEQKYTLANAGWGAAIPKILDGKFYSFMGKALTQ